MDKTRLDWNCVEIRRFRGATNHGRTSSIWRNRRHQWPHAWVCCQISSIPSCHFMVATKMATADTQKVRLHATHERADTRALTPSLSKSTNERTI
ncbi:hypothetical protein EYF80_042924 [Liparis tanakae]|uniref:Uncharacterized protein n=1 Tax=Liparis tanakae TaxID=230148 RepID=A0A4Z2FZV9_9TELE|nr:hypothetical protein EYF80_042924 [Liparis tanakae]